MPTNPKQDDELLVISFHEDRLNNFDKALQTVGNDVITLNGKIDTIGVKVDTLIGALAQHAKDDAVVAAKVSDVVDRIERHDERLAARKAKRATLWKVLGGVGAAGIGAFIKQAAVFAWKRLTHQS